MNKQQTDPCKDCPFKKTSLRGWLGNYDNAIQFLQQSENEERMPCHMSVDYEAEDWEDLATIAPQCAGRADHFANRCKRPRNQELIIGKSNDNIFADPQDFINHHILFGLPPKIAILGYNIIKV